MKKIPVMFLALSLVLAPYASAVNAQGPSSGLPPIEQPLVREGDFAVELATALDSTSSHDEAAAERYLLSIGITPRNGWISDYPMTPDILAEVRESAVMPASSGNPRISKNDAAGIVDKVGIAMNLPLRARGGKYVEGSDSEYVEPSALEAYYYDNEPPVVTYYPPPDEYAYLYDWVPDPFWWGGYAFGGFFILRDFDRHHHHRHHVTNHVTNRNGTVSRINPATRTFAGATAKTANGTGAPSSGNLATPGSARDADRAARDMDRFSPGPRLNTGNASRSSSFGGPTSSAPPGRSVTGGGHR